MPELPDIEVSKNYVNSTSLHKTIESVDTPGDQVFEASPGHIRSELKGKQLQETRRTGKQLFIRYGDGAWLTLHFGMTGSLKYYKNGDPPEYTALLLHFDNGYRLVFTCPRKLARVGLTDSPDDFEKENDLGPDALGLSRKAFLEKMHDRRGGIKSALMDQSFMAGIGNIYSDEILFQSGIHPKAAVKKLDDDQLDTVYDNMMKVLKKSIECDADPAKLPSGYIVHHREDGADCPGGKGKVKRIKVNGRSCYYCPEIQSLPDT